MKDSYIRFRCTETDKAIVEAMAKQDGKTMSEYLLDLVRQDYSHCHEEEFEVVVIRKGKEIGRQKLGTYLVDENNRASKYTTWSELEAKAEEYYSTFRSQSGQSYSIQSNGRKVTTNAMSDYMWIE